MPETSLCDGETCDHDCPACGSDFVFIFPSNEHRCGRVHCANVWRPEP